KVYPLSTASASSSVISFLSAAGPYAWLIPIHPRPMAETFKSFPKVRVFILPYLFSSDISKGSFFPSHMLLYMQRFFLLLLFGTRPPRKFPLLPLRPADSL